MVVENRKPCKRSATFWLASLSIVVVALLLSLGFTPSSGGQPQTVARPANVVPEVSTPLSIDLADSYPLSSAFWGVDLRPYSSIGAPQATEISATPLNYVVFPGGAIGDRYNFTSNVITNLDGSTYIPPTSLAQFVSWCKNVGCHAILQVPGETDSPGTAASYVAYTENTLHFHPDYWEIGNEPALWEHFDIPWAQWTLSASSKVTPEEYAQVVHADIAAMRQVDPTIPVTGLPGLGSGGSGETTWITDSVALNGPNLSAIAIHVYAAGPGPSHPTLPEFYASLQSQGNLPTRMVADRAAIRAACPTCKNLPILVTELGSAITGGPYDPYLDGFANVPFIAAELVQGIEVNASNLDVYAFESTYGGSLFSGGGPNLDYWLYADMMSQFGTYVAPTTGPSEPVGFYAATTTNAVHSFESLFLVNTNVSSAANVGLAAAGFPTSSSVQAWTWNRSTNAPLENSWPNGVPSTWVVPPMSVTLLRAQVSSTPTNQLYPVSGTVVALGTHAPVAGATLTVTGTNLTQSGSTGPIGQFSFYLVNATYGLAVSAPGYENLTTTFTISGPSTRSIDVVLVPGQKTNGSTPQEYAVEGTVLTLPGDGPVAQATVTFSGGAVPQSTVTLSNGSFAFTLANGTYVVNVTASGYWSVTASIVVEGGAVQGINFVLVPTSTSEYTIQGTVIDAVGAPLSSAVVFVQGSNFSIEVAVAANGTFGAEVPDGAYTLTATASGFSSVTLHVIVSGVGASGLVFRMTSGASGPSSKATSPLGSGPIALSAIGIFGMVTIGVTVAIVCLAGLSLRPPRTAPRRK
ncbi:MAG: carboxypeptidase regulatory-like domain-containing protein [Thermoplasmata archaeon]